MIDIGRSGRLAAWLAIAATVGLPTIARAQIVETVGGRALGMGGAFVAVANDSTATWWNPGALAAGPFVDVTIGRAVTSRGDHVPAWRDQATAWALTTPVFGVSYYRVRLAEVGRVPPTGGGGASRQQEAADLQARSLAASEFGATVVQTVWPGVHAGATLKYVRGTARAGLVTDADSAADGLDQAMDLGGGSAEGRFDLDIGALAVAGPVRLGGVIRNVRAARFESASGGVFELPRQVRVGAAFDAEAVAGIPLMLAVDADLRRYPTIAGDRRVLAVGAEQWFLGKRVGVRAGGRFDTAGVAGRAATAGLSVAVRSGLFVDGHVVRGGADDERGWGVSARVSY